MFHLLIDQLSLQVKQIALEWNMGKHGMFTSKRIGML